MRPGAWPLSRGPVVPLPASAGVRQPAGQRSPRETDSGGGVRVDDQIAPSVTLEGNESRQVVHRDFSVAFNTYPFVAADVSPDQRDGGIFQDLKLT